MLRIEEDLVVVGKVLRNEAGGIALRIIFRRCAEQSKGLSFAVERTAIESIRSAQRRETLILLGSLTYAALTSALTSSGHEKLLVLVTLFCASSSTAAQVRFSVRNSPQFAYGESPN